MKIVIKSALILLIAVVSSIIFSCNIKPGGTAAANDTIVASVYQFAKHTSMTSEESAKTLMRLMELKSVPDFSGKNGNKVYYTVPEDASVFFEQELASGNLTLSKSLKDYYGAFVPKLPQVAEAERIALEYLKKYQLVPTDNSEMKLVHQGGLRATTVVGGNNPGPVIDKLITLNYGRFLDNLQVIGPGSKIVISIGNEGNVMRLIRRWRPIDLSSKSIVRQAELISQNQAEEQLKINMAANFGEKATYTVVNTRKAYWDGNGSLLQPVYAFETMVTLPEGTVKPFKFISVVNMLKNPRESIVLQLDPEAKKYIKNYKDIQKTEPSDKND